MENNYLLYNSFQFWTWQKNSKILHRDHNVLHFCFTNNNRMNKLGNKLMQSSYMDNLYILLMLFEFIV